MAARRSQQSGPENEPTFEEAIAKLEAIVDAMEHEQLPLENLVEHYEQGSALLTRCETILQAARGRIELITLKNKDQIALASETNLEQAPAPTDLSGQPEDPDDDDDIRLF